MEKIELLAPAGDLQRLKYAVMYGADAVYIGGKKFSLRSRASNFDIPEITEGVAFAKKYGAHVHVTINMLPHEDDFEGLETYVRQLDEAGVTAVICASLYIVKVVKSLNTKMEIHLSTQQSTLNSQAVKFYQMMGVDRVVLGRELTIDEVEQIVKTSTIPIEGFIHGGMCVNYSGRCTLSNYMTLRDANRGGCAQSCRWKYRLFADNQEISDHQTLFSMSSKDLMAADYLPRLIDMGITSLKIEGRMKSLYYIATVVSAYRQLIDTYYQNKTITDEQMQYFLSELNRAENRPTYTGFYGGTPNQAGHLYGVNGAGVTHDFLAQVLSYEDGYCMVQVRNYFKEGDDIEVIGPNHFRQHFTIAEIYDESGESVQICNKPMQVVKVKIPFVIDTDYLFRKGQV